MIRFPDPDSLPFVWTTRTDHARAIWLVGKPINVTIKAPGDLGGASDLVVIPAGFPTDGASVPWWARWKLDPWGRVGLAAVLHDYLLTVPGLPKWEADLLFLYALRSQGIPAFQATVMYLAVRLRRPRPAA